MTRHAPIYFFLILCNAMLGGCAGSSSHAVHYQAVAFGQLQAVAAEYVTTVRDKATGVERSVHWRLLRNGDRVEIHHLNTDISDIWSRTSKDLWFYEKAFHKDKTVIEYVPNDIDMLRIGSPWMSLAIGIDPGILQALPAGQAGKPVMGAETVMFSGELNGAVYRITWMPAANLPARVSQDMGGILTITELSQRYPLVDAPWSLADVSRYRIIDYSDLGDLERDPFVIKVQSDLPGGHAYGHSH